MRYIVPLIGSLLLISSSALAKDRNFRYEEPSRFRSSSVNNDYSGRSPYMYTGELPSVSTKTPTIVDSPCIYVPQQNVFDKQYYPQRFCPNGR